MLVKGGAVVLTGDDRTVRCYNSDDNERKARKKRGGREGMPLLLIYLI